jgi:hypothetical protein
MFNVGRSMFESFVIRKFLIPSFVAAKRSRIVILSMLLASAIERFFWFMAADCARQLLAVVENGELYSEESST